MKKTCFALLVLCAYVFCITPAFGQTDSLTVWAIESSMITDYQTNGQSIWMEQETGIPVTWISTPKNGWYQAFQASVMSGEEVDIYLYDFDTSEATMLGMDMNFIIPLEDYITAENTPNIHAILEADPELRSHITAPDGHIYTLFTNNAYDLAGYKQKLWVNRYFLEKYTAETGVGMPETTDELEKMLVYFANNDMNGDGELNEIPFIGRNGVDGMYNLFGSFLPVNSGNGYGCVFDKSGEVVFSFNQEGFKEALAFVRKLFEQNLISPDTFTISPEERYAYTSGSKQSVRTGVVSGVSISEIVQLSNETDAMTYSDYIPMAPLAGPNGVRTIVSSGETMLALRNAITIHCEDPITAIKWLDAGYGEAARMYAVYGGTENQDWMYSEGTTLNGTGKVIVSLHDAAENSTWSGQGIVYRITEDDYLTMDATQIATNNALATYRANLVYRPYAQKSVWPALVWPGEFVNEAAEYSEINGLIKPAVTEYYTDVILGRKDLDDDWDTYVTELDNMGLNRYLELTQLYIDISK